MRTTSRTLRATGVRRAALAFAVLAAVSVATLRAQDERARIPQLQPPPPLDPRFLQRFQGNIRTTIDDVSFRTAIGQMVSFDRLEIVMDPEDLGSDVVHAALIRVVRPSFISPVDSVTTPFDPFLDIPGPRTIVDRLIIEDGTFGAHAHPSQYEGRWLWLARNVDLDVRDIALGGGGSVSARLASASTSAEMKGRPILVRAATAALQRSGSVLDADARVRLADSDLAVAGSMRRNGAFRADVRATPLAFADARAFVRGLPAEGTAELDATIEGGAGPLAVALRRLAARARASVITASGDIRMGDGGEVRDFVVDVPSLVAADLDTLFGVALPGGGTWSGGLRANGPLASGVAIAGALERAAGETPPNGWASDDAVLPRFAFEGTLSTEPETAVALQVDAERIPVREGVVAAAVRVNGPLDSLSIGGVVRGTGMGPASEIVAQVDALVLERAGAAHRLLRATTDVTAVLPAADDAPAREVTARAEGSAVLAGDGAVTARIVSDALPLALLPLPPALDSVRGAVRADLVVTGTVDTPVLGGTLDVRDGGFRVADAGLTVSDLGGSIVVRDGVADLDGLAARAYGGTIDVACSIRLLAG